MANLGDDFRPIFPGLMRRSARRHQPHRDLLCGMIGNVGVLGRWETLSGMGNLVRCTLKYSGFR
jgi:hypothetical protein